MPSTYKITSRVQPGTRRITLRTGQTADQVRDFMCSQAVILPAVIAHDGMSCRQPNGGISFNSYAEQ